MEREHVSASDIEQKSESFLGEKGLFMFTLTKLLQHQLVSLNEWLHISIIQWGKKYLAATDGASFQT